MYFEFNTHEIKFELIKSVYLIDSAGVKVESLNILQTRCTSNLSYIIMVSFSLFSSNLSIIFFSS